MFTTSGTFMHKSRTTRNRPSSQSGSAMILIATSMPNERANSNASKLRPRGMRLRNFRKPSSSSASTPIKMYVSPIFFQNWKTSLGQKIETVEKIVSFPFRACLGGSRGLEFFGNRSRIGWGGGTNGLGAHPGLRHGDGGPRAAGADRLMHVERNGHHYANGMAGLPQREQDDFL